MSVFEQIKLLVSPTTKRGRAIRTALQGIVALTTFIIGFLSIPGLEDFLVSNGWLAQVGAFGVWIGVVSYIQNAFEALIKYFWNS